MFGKKGDFKEGDRVFSSRPDGKDSNNIIFGVVTGVDDSKIGVNGLLVNPVGLKNKIVQNKAGARSKEMLENPTPQNCIFALIYRIEQENFTEVLDLEKDRVIPISQNAYNILDGWVRESLPELINNILSLPSGSERDQARRLLKHRMETLIDKNLRRNLYSVCRSLKILI